MQFIGVHLDRYMQTDYLFEFISIVLAIKMEISRRVVQDIESNIGRS